MSAPTDLSNAAFEEIPHPYDHDLDVRTALNEAFERAKEDARRVLVIVGGEWCPDCRVLAGMLQIDDVQSFVRPAFEIVEFSIGRYDVNQDAVARLGFADGAPGAPIVLVITPEGGVVNRATCDLWRTAREKTPQDLVDYLEPLVTQPAPPSDTIATFAE